MQLGYLGTHHQTPFSPLRMVMRLVLAGLKIVLLVLLVLVGGGMWLYYEYGRDLPDPAEIGRHRARETALIYARDGKTLLYELVDPDGGKRTVVLLDHIPRILRDATISVEDGGFYEHPGVDWRGVVRAMWLNYTNQKIVSGGSTITQQLVRNILLAPVELDAEVSDHVRYERKMREAILAYRVTQVYSKDQILSLYLNEVYYGAQAYGVEAAAQAYFGKHVWELSDGEATLIAGLPQSPTLLNPFINFEGARARQRITLDLMVKYYYLTPQQAEAIYNQPIELKSPTTPILAPHFVHFVREQLEQRYGPELLYQGGLRIITSIDMSLQQEAQRIVQEHIAALRDRNAHNAGVIILDPSGQVLAMVGSVDYYDSANDGEVNVTLAARQPGSALKPIVYAAALQKGWTPATIIWDAPTEFPQSNGVVYRPMNYDNRWHGPQRMRMALANSLNIPAVKTLEYVGIDAFVELATHMGITTFDDRSRYGLSMALGSMEVRLLDLTTVYNTFNTGGRYQPPVTILSIANRRGETLEHWAPTLGEPVLGPQSAQIAYLMTDMLSDNQARWYLFGRGNVLELPDHRPAAAKTGTSNEWRDSWAVGYTPDVTIGVWVGNNNNAPMQEIAGSNGAGLIWRDLMLWYHRDREHRPFLRPPGIEEKAICADTGASASNACPRPIREQFLAGTAPNLVDVTTQHIQVANNGTCVAASYTPPIEVRLVEYLVYPPEFREWAIRNGIPQPPTERCPPPESPEYALAILDTIAASGVITREQVPLSGRARGSYTLEIGAGIEPKEWLLIYQEPLIRPAGLLGVWYTDVFPSGTYTIRLRVMTPEGVTAEVSQVVQLKKAEESTPTPEQDQQDTES